MSSVAIRAACLLLSACCALSPPRLVAQTPEHALDPEALRCFQLYRDNPEAAVQLAGEHLAAAGLPKPDELVFVTCKAISHAIAGQQQEAKDAIAKVERLLHDHPMPPGYRLRALSGVGAALQLAGDTRGALDAYDRALKAAEDEDVPEAQVTTLINIATLHTDELAAYEQAETLFARAAQIEAKLGHRSTNLVYNRGMNLLRMGRTADARREFEETLALARTDRQGVLEARASAELVALTQAPDAQHELARLRNIQIASGDVSGASRTATLAARLALNASDPATALAEAERALSLLPDEAFPAERRDAAHARIAALAAQERWREAHEAATRLHTEEIQRLRSGQLNAMAALQATLEDAHNREQLTQARQQGELNALRAAHQRTQRNLALLALGLLVALTLGFFGYQRRVNHRLRRLSTSDSLTKLLNRHAAGHRLNDMVPARVDAGDARAVVFLIDIDHFKAINDHHGHDAGDEALVIVARTLVTTCDDGAVVSRWGGEEFLVGCASLNAKEASELAERLRKAIKNVTIGRGVESVTVSIGFAAAPVFPPGDGGTADVTAGHWPDAVTLADRALYAAKAAGRNGWVGLWGHRGASLSIDDVIEDPSEGIASGAIRLLSSDSQLVWPGSDRRRG